MSEPNLPRWIIAGHPSSQPHLLAQELQMANSEIALIDGPQMSTNEINLIDACMFVINAKTGVSKEMIDFWARISDLQIPRMVVIHGLEFSEVDFDDIVLIVNRVLEAVVTPYLVLHDDVGEPTGLISIRDSMVHDYSGENQAVYPADEELISLVAEFKEELELATTEMDDSSYSQGLLVPALPLIVGRKIGVQEIQGMWSILTRR